MAGNEMTAREYEVATRPDIVFAEHDGVSLLGDLYLPKGLGKAPVLVGVHGGGWQLGDRKFYTHWGNYLARNGYDDMLVSQQACAAEKREVEQVVPDPGHSWAQQRASHSPEEGRL